MAETSGSPKKIDWQDISGVRVMEHPVCNARWYRFDIFTLDVKTGELTGEGKGRTVLREQQLQLLLTWRDREN